MAEKIKRYKMKNGTTEETIRQCLGRRLKNGGTWISENAKTFALFPLYEDVSVHIAFPEDLSKWDDYNNVLVLDEEFGQPYTPFYAYIDERKPDWFEVFPFLERVVQEYNRAMSTLPFLEDCGETA